MYSVSQSFLDQIRGPHQITSLVEYSKTGVDGPWIEMPYGVVMGSVTYDRTADARRSLTMEVADWANPFNPDSFAAQELLSPYDTLIRVHRGLVHPGGQAELVPLGVYRVYETIQNANSLAITGYSQEIDIKDRRFYVPWIRFGTFAIQSEISLLITTAVPDATVTFASGLSNHNISNYLYEEDRIGALTDLVTSIGADVWCTQTGVFYIGRPNPGTGSPDWSINSGEDGVLIEYSKKRTREGVYNGVVVTGENVTGNTTPAQGVRALVVDTDPLSPTYWDGEFGKVPRFYSSQYIRTLSQATAAGQGILNKEKGLATSIDFDSVPNPALDTNDLIEVVYPDGSAENHVVDTLTIGIGADESMTGTSRVVQVV